MSLDWLDGKEFSINTFLLMDRDMISVIADQRDAKVVEALSVILSNNETLKWYLINKCPECRNYFVNLVNEVHQYYDKDTLKEYEDFLIEALDTLIVYMYPEVMEKLDYIALWDEERLLSITDFSNKRVLDIGSGTGRLAFSVADQAEFVYAVEPVFELRDYMRNKSKELKYENVYIIDGKIEALPFPNDFFDVVVSGHVFGGDYEAEYLEMCRVLRNDGYIIDCPGEDERKKPNGPSKELIDMGFEYSHYVSKSDGDVYRYWKKIKK